MVHFRSSIILASSVLLTASVLGLPGCSSSDDGGLLATLTPATPGQAAREAFNVYDADKRRNALGLLAGASFGGEEPYLRTYRLLIDDPDATVRAAAVKALGAHGGVEDAPVIIARLKDEAPFVRWEAAKALQRIHNPAAALPLVETLRNDEDADVRLAAAEALGQYAQPAVYDTLVGALTDRNYAVVDAAVRSLRTLTGRDGDADPAAWLKWSSTRRGELFAGRRAYTYRPYQKPPGVVGRMLPWKDDDPQAPPRTPVGLNRGEASSG